MDQYDNQDATDDVKSRSDRLERMKRPRGMTMMTMREGPAMPTGVYCRQGGPSYESRRNRPSDFTTTLFLSMGECVREAEWDMRGEFLCATAADIFFR